MDGGRPLYHEMNRFRYARFVIILTNGNCNQVAAISSSPYILRHMIPEQLVPCSIP